MTKRGFRDISFGLDVSPRSDPASSTERALDIAFALGTSHVVPRMPWEQTPFLRSVLGPTTVPWLKPVTVLRSATFIPSPSSGTKTLSVQEKKCAVRSVFQDRLATSPDVDQTSAPLRWAETFMLNPECSIPGRLLLECCEDEMKLVQTMADLFAKKATSTVTTRAGSMAMYCAWVLSQHPGEAVLPIREARVYDYACMCRDTAKSASRIGTFVGTLKYVASEFGFEGAEEVSKSPRVLGAAYSMLVRRPPRKRAEALHPAMICWLEIACFALPDPFDRMSSAFSWRELNDPPRRKHK